MTPFSIDKVDPSLGFDFYCYYNRGGYSFIYKTWFSTSIKVSIS